MTELLEQHEPEQLDDHDELVTCQPAGHDSPQEKKVPELIPQLTELFEQHEPEQLDDQLELDTW